MKIGLVLAGGGGRGAYQIGAWKALRHLGVDKYVTSIAGTSIGALNACLFMQDDLELAENIWKDIKAEKILPIDGIEFYIKSAMLSLGLKTLSFIKKKMPQLIEQGKLDREGLLEIIDKKIDLDKIKNSPINCYVCCTEIPDIKIKYFNLQGYNIETIKSILLATSAIPILFQCEEIDTKRYLDGGLVDNVPIQAVYGDGCNVIVVIHLTKLDPIDRSIFPNAKIIEIVPTEIEEGVVDGMLNFSNEAIKKRIQQGYEDTINLMLPILEIARCQVEEELLNDSVKNKLTEGIKNMYLKITRGKS